MATFISYKAFNFNSIQEAGSSSADPNATDTQYQLSGSTVSCTVSGSGFTYDQTSKVLSGTITDFSATTSGSEYYSVFDLNADAAASSTAYSQGYTMGSTTLSGAKGELALWLAGDDAVDGSDSSDYLFSGAGNDSVNGGTGNDTLWGGLGNDTLDGGTGTNKAVFSGKSSAYALSAHADGTITISGTDGTDTLTNIQSLTFDDKNISVMKALPLAHLEGLPYYAKIQSYFIAMADRPATDDELAQYADLLTHQTGSVWLDSNGATGTTGSLVGALNASDEFAALKANKSYSQIVDEMYARLTGQDAPSQTIHNYYVNKLTSGSIKIKGLANAFLNDLAIMPKADNFLGQPGTWQVNMFDNLTPTDYLGYLNKLELVGVNVTNLDDAGNLS